MKLLLKQEKGGHRSRLVLPRGPLLPVSSRADLEGSALSEVSQAEKDGFHVISLICGI